MGCVRRQQEPPCLRHSVIFGRNVDFRRQSRAVPPRRAAAGARRVRRRIDRATCAGAVFVSRSSLSAHAGGPKALTATFAPRSESPEIARPLFFFKQKTAY